MPFKVMHRCRYQSKARMQLPFEVIADYCSNVGHFASLNPPLAVQGKRLIEKLPIRVNWTFFARFYGWGATSDYWLEIGAFEEGGSVSAKFSRSWGRPPRTIFARLDRPMNALQLCFWQYSDNKTAILDGKGRFAFLISLFDGDG